MEDVQYPRLRLSVLALHLYSRRLLCIGVLLSTMTCFLVPRAYGRQSEPNAVEEHATDAVRPPGEPQGRLRRSLPFLETWDSNLSWLQERGGKLSALYLMDSSYNAVGGIRQRGINRSRFELMFDVQLKPLLGLEDGNLFVNYQVQIGRNAQRDVGSIQGISNIDANGRNQIFELWYQQWLFDRKVRFKLGKVEAKQEFAVVNNAEEFLNGAMEFSPTIFVLPAYPDSSVGLNMFVYPTESVYAGFGLYDGSASRGVHTGIHGPETLAQGNLFFIGEVGGQWTFHRSQLPGRLSIGGWGHNGTFDRFRGGQQRGTAGAYAVADQTVWRENPETEGDEQGIAMYAQYGYADETVSFVGQHAGLGAVWTGLFPRRDKEPLGFGISFARLSEHAQFKRSAEIFFELFYKFQLSAAMSLKPDLQYFINPSGGVVRNALVGSVRLEMLFN